MPLPPFSRAKAMMMNGTSKLILLAGLLLGSVVAGCENADARPPQKAALASTQDRLLDMAFDVAGRIPVQPHIKDRARAQEAVIAACLDLDRMDKAAAYIGQMDATWRKGAAHADIAAHLAKAGDAAEAKRHLDRAGAIARDQEDWRRDRIRVRMARAHLILGQADKARELSTGVEDSEKGKLEGASPRELSREDLDAFLRTVRERIEAAQFDPLKNALHSCVELHGKSYLDAPRRRLLEEAVQAGLVKMPVFIRIDLLLGLAANAVAHDGTAHALEFVNQAQSLVDDATWPAYFSPIVKARVAAMRFRAGEADAARQAVGEALARFKAERDQIVNIDRAEALAPVAEAYCTMGDGAAALAVYRLAIEESVENPNSRPRAEDLSMLCRSMALQSFEPDAAMWTRLAELSQQLGDPW